MARPLRHDDPLPYEPYPDALLSGVASPGARYAPREAISLDFLAGLQQLRPRQRAALLLRDVAGFELEEVADMLAASAASVADALRTARATVERALPDSDREPPPAAGSACEQAIVERFADGVHRADMDAVAALLTDDARLAVPPEPVVRPGREAIARRLTGDIASGLPAPLFLAPTRANGRPAFGCYVTPVDGLVSRGYGIMVLALEGERVAAVTVFRDAGLLSRFGLPRTLGH
jgi:hypothetical protein